VSNAKPLQRIFKILIDLLPAMHFVAHPKTFIQCAFANVVLMMYKIYGCPRSPPSYLPNYFHEHRARMALINSFHTLPLTRMATFMPIVKLTTMIILLLKSRMRTAMH
jgi:hypothetical protein